MYIIGSTNIIGSDHIYNNIVLAIRKKLIRLGYSGAYDGEISVTNFCIGTFYQLCKLGTLTSEIWKVGQINSENLHYQYRKLT